MRGQAAQRGFVHIQVTANLAGSPMFRLLQTPHQSLHLSFLILVLSFTLEIRQSHGVLRTEYHMTVMKKSRKDLFSDVQKGLDRLGDIESGCALVAHHEVDEDVNRVAELRKSNIVHINGMSSLNTLLGVNVVRPLLAVRKWVLVDFTERVRVY